MSNLSEPLRRLDETPEHDQQIIIKPQTRNPVVGAAWLLRGFDYFKRDWQAWLGVTVIYLLIAITVAFVPPVNAIFIMLSPIFLAGLMLGCKKQDEGETFSFVQLFAAFSHRLGRLALLGLLYVLFSLLALLVIMLAALVLFADLVLLIRLAVGGFTAGGADSILLLNTLIDLASGDFDVMGYYYKLLLAILIGLAAYIPALMALWFAPALIVLADQPLFAAMRLSFTGCLMNIIPLLVYGLVFLVLMIIATLPLLLGWLILIPMATASIYLAYKDIFIAEEA